MRESLDNNYVRIKIDDDIFKVRISSIEIPFPVEDKISVTFTNATKSTGTMNAVAEAVKNATSMATSFSSVATQAEKGQQANETFQTIKNEGLNAGLMAVKGGGEEQDVVVDNHGILLRRKIFETGEYSPYQMKLINRNIVMTDDNWNTAKMAIGYGMYEGSPYYGVWCDLLVGNLLCGNKLKIIGGKDETTGNATVVIDGSGITLDGGAIKWTKKLPTSSVEGLDDTVNGFVDAIGDLQSQIDGEITSWFYDYVPKTTNEPASTWTTDADKIKHEGDLFYNTATGAAYRYVYNSSTKEHEWSIITDMAISEALARAAEAQDTADNKRRVFVDTPTPPYDIGDLWAEGRNGDIMKCKVAKTEYQSYSSRDWEKASKYTDDTKAESVEKSINIFQTNVNNLLNADISTTVIGEDYVFAPKIGGGYLYIKNQNDKRSVTIDPQQTYSSGGHIFKITDKNGTTTIGADSEGNAIFNGKVTASSGSIGGWDIGTGENSGWLINYGTTSAYGDCGIYWENTDYYAVLNQSNWEMGTNDACLFRLNVNNPNYIGHGSDDSNDNRLYCNLGYINMTSKGYIDINSSNSINFNSSNSINFNNLTKFYKGIRIQASLSDYVELGVTALDSSATNAYFTSNGSAAIGYRLQVGVGISSFYTGYTFYVGGSSYVIGSSYTNSGTMVTSDKNKKNSISTPSDCYVRLFDAINLRRFKYNDGASDRYHLGVIAQELEEAMRSVGISSQDFGGLVIDEQGNYFVRYDEINMLTALKVKQIEERIKVLEDKLNCW